MEKRAVYQPVSIRSSSEYGEENASLGNAASSKRCGPLYERFKAGFGLLLIGLYTAVVIGATWTMKEYQATQSRRHGTRFLPSPANDYLVWEPRVIKATDGQISGPRYFGEPDDELDGNWHELLEPSNTGVPAEWMHDLGREKEGVQLPEGTYFGVMAVFHNLHCLKHVQRALHPEHYGLDLLEGNEVTEHWDHLNHCLYQLKHAVMCQGDTTLLTMYWHDRMYQPVANWSSPHECINWDRFMEWVVPNSVDVHRDGVLVHPKYGALMKDGEPTALWYKSFRESGFGKLGNEFLHNRPNNTEVHP